MKRLFIAISILFLTFSFHAEEYAEFSEDMKVLDIIKFYMDKDWEYKYESSTKSFSFTPVDYYFNDIEVIAVFVSTKANLMSVALTLTDKVSNQENLISLFKFFSYDDIKPYYNPTLNLCMCNSLYTDNGYYIFQITSDNHLQIIYTKIM